MSKVSLYNQINMFIQKKNYQVNMIIRWIVLQLNSHPTLDNKNLFI